MDEVITFEYALLKVYRKEPCRVLPNALWKIWKVIEGYETKFAVTEGVITSLKMWGDDSLRIYW
ncbi:MAG: hypothetical protein ACOC85_01950 [Thermoplasmatota archaeon]